MAPTDGFTGPVTLSLQGAGPEIAATFDGGAATAQVNVAGASASATLKIKSSKAGASAFKVVAVSGDKTVSKDVTFTASKILTISIPADAEMNKGTAGNPRTDAFGPAAGIVVTTGAGLTLNIKNLDATGHIIHGGGQGGFNHGNTNAPIQQGDSDNPRTLSTGTFNFYLHDQGQVTTGKLIVK